MSCSLPAGGRPLPASDVKPPEGPSSKSKDPPREEEKERKKKKHKKRSRTRSRSPKYHSSSKSRPRSHSKAKHCLPSAYRTARRSRWVCGAPEVRGCGGCWVLLPQSGRGECRPGEHSRTAAAGKPHDAFRLSLSLISKAHPLWSGFWKIGLYKL